MNPPQTRPTLRTARLTLRPLADDDLLDLVAMNGDPEVMRFIGPPMTAGQVAAELPGWLDGKGDFGLWAGLLDSGFAGVWFLTTDPHDTSAGEIGWRLPRRTWGHGYAVEGAGALVDHGLRTLGLTRLWAETMAVNTRSRRVMERLGMRHVRTYVGEGDDPLPGWEQGEGVYELTRDQWVARRTQSEVAGGS
jgi:RimJ/RimL family protein N-acetyltransferase